ncbi:uncharacterized protein LOC128211247 isoform X1 [Mya arenaria]|uniref:uncharacterized protein LOC128211247 isoform X1 n=1 Tax=Mya arenaria TaxID=6604 RepID=UPI0022E13237|nr:uncharacterized protein LOC128211247 isoform X1 [Mya arenaria]XP_052771775.1 uncharacterized protein LOC128211247 isoform X1 [Mya arenaria]XP_052771785.1 uncharacterized protein LOC128211247 isoform X1 [Mya arenaria]
MGTCYSKSGHEAGATSKDKRPKEKKGAKNGHVGPIKKHHLLVAEVQKDISDTVYTEDSHIAAPNIENCMNKSQQTSQDQLARDANRNIEYDGFVSVSLPDNVDQNDCVVIDSTSPLLCNEAEDTPDRDKHEHLAMCDGKVSSSDSGIMVESSCKICDKLDECSEKHGTRLESVEDEVEASCEKASGQSKAQSACLSTSYKHYNSHSNPPVVHRDSHSSAPSEHCQGECQGHLFISRSFVNKSSESLLKSSIKKGHTKTRGRKRLSWKSADRLNGIDSMSISLDRTKSMCSSMLGDDISLLNAPLATFDSVDFAIGDSYDISKLLGDQNKVQYASDTFQFQFDFSGIEGENKQSVASIDRLSERSKISESSTDLDKIKLAIQRQSSVGTPTEHRSFLDTSDTSYELSSAIEQPEVTTMTMNGRDVVVIDADLFSQIIDEIQSLKMKLSQLTEVIQDGEEDESRPSISVLSSSA